MGRKVKQLKNYTTEQIESLFESDENDTVGVKLYAFIHIYSMLQRAQTE